MLALAARAHAGAIDATVDVAAFDVDVRCRPAAERSISVIVGSSLTGSNISSVASGYTRCRRICSFSMK